MSGPFFIYLFRVLKFLSAESKKKKEKQKSAKTKNRLLSALWNLSKNDDDFTIKKGNSVCFFFSLSLSLSLSLICVIVIHIFCARSRSNTNTNRRENDGIDDDI